VPTTSLFTAADAPPDEKTDHSGSRTGSPSQSSQSESESSAFLDAIPDPPFELEMLEGALIVATARLDEQLVAVTAKVQSVLTKLPVETNPVNLDELRRVKGALVELESRSESLVQLLEEVLDDDDEIRDFNLSSRPQREEKRRQRERVRLERDRGAGDGTADAAGSLALGAYGANRDRDNRADRSSDDERADEEVDDAIRELEDAEVEERELEEVEDVLEYYLQRAASTQNEAERLLQGARDLEESIGVSLSARRLAVIRLELMLSIGSFACAIGAVISGVFGMNLRSTLEDSVPGFWLTTVGIVCLCSCICWVLWRFAKRRKIL